MQQSISRELLLKTVTELNGLLGLVPSIPLDLESDVLRAAIQKASSLVCEKDDFSDEATNVLLSIGGLTEEVSTVFDMKVSFDTNTEESTLKTVTDIEAPLVKDKVKRRKPHMSRLEELIAEGKYTSEQIVTIILSEFPSLKKETIANYIRSSKSEKYTQFGVLAIEDIHGVLRFNS